MSHVIKPSQFKGVIDTTLRDGQQSPLLFDTYTYRFSLDDKMTILKGLAESGVTKVELFSPIVSSTEKRDFVHLREFIKEKYPSMMLLAHCRCHPQDIEEALNVGFDGLNIYIGTSNETIQHSHGISRLEIQKRARRLVQTLRRTYPSLYIRFSAEDCFRTGLEDIYNLYDEVAPSVNTFGMPDTVGIATPHQVQTRVKALRKRYPTVDLECHFHNDRGYALINAVTAVLSGATYIDTSLWGLAERSGITSFTALLFNLAQEDPALCSTYNLKLCYPLNVLMGSILKYHVPFTEPVSVTNRTHTAGVHQKAVINNVIVYEAVDLRTFGVTRNQLLVGPLSGWNSIYYYLRECAYFDLTKEQAQEITTQFKRHVGRINRMTDPESILMEVVNKTGLQKLPVQKIKTGARIEQLT